MGLNQANAFVRAHHRHHGPVRGAKFCIAVAAESEVVGVAIIGRPRARMLDDGWTLEVNRSCTLGTKNACSMLYGACRRIALEMGYKRLITYTLSTESGESLIAAGWKRTGLTRAESWSRQSRPRTDARPPEVKVRWEAITFWPVPQGT